MIFSANENVMIPVCEECAYMTKEKNVTFENVTVILLGIIMTTGIICEIVVHSGFFIWIVPDLRNVALAVLQIQAGISTLAVALLALVSGLIGAEVYGISVARYYMSIRPKFFKQQKVIVGTISLVFLGVFAELLECYHLVFSFFICEWLLIVVSVIGIMPVFSGVKLYKREIREYLINEIEHNNHEAISDIIETYKSEPNVRNLDEEILWLALKSLLCENTDDSICILNNEWCAMVSAQLKHNEAWVVKRGLEILQETYHVIWMFVLKKRINSNRRQFLRFSRIFMKIVG